MALNRMEREVSKVEVPLSYADQLYHLRLHITWCGESVEDAISARDE